MNIQLADRSRWLTMIFLMAGAVLHAQCPPSGTAWMEKIVAIEGSNASVTDRLKEFTALQSLHQRCGAGRDSILARILHRAGDLYRQTGDVEKGIRYAKEAASINSSGLPGAQRPFLTHSYYNLGLYYSLLYLFAESNNYFDSSIALGLQYPPKTFIALMAFEQKAFSFYKTADYQQSIETADKGILVAERLGDSLSVAYLRMQKAQSQLALAQAGEAEKNIKEVIRVFTLYKASADYLATSYSIYARLLTAKNDHRGAAAYYSKAFETNRQQHNDAQCARDLIDLGYVYDRDLHDHRKAIATYERGLSFAKQANDAYLQAGLYINTGVAFWRQKDYRRALRYYQAGLNVMPIHFTDTAISSNPASSMLKISGANNYLYHLLYNKGEALLDLYKKEKDKTLLRDALSSFRLADKLVDQMRWEQYNEGSKLFWRGKTKKMYERAIEACYLLQNPENAFFFFEKSRAVLLNDKLNELGARKYLSAVDLAREQSLRIRLLSLQHQLTTVAENTGTYKDYREQLYNVQDEQDKFIRDLEKRYPAYYRYKYDTTVNTVEGVRAILTRQQQTLVEYFSGDSVMYILSVMPSGSELYAVPFKNYNEMALELLSIVSDRSQLNRKYDLYQRLAYGLYDSLLGRISIPTKRLIISPDDAFIPYELLLTDATAGNSFLLKKYAVSYTYSASFLSRNNAPEQATHQTLLGFAPVEYNAWLQQAPLLGADRSLETIGSYFPSPRLFTKEDATKKQFLKHLPQYMVVQLYSHANADSTEQEPVLYLSDSVLRLTELQALGPLHTQLAVLSACNTGTGRNIRGEGIFSLSRGFAAAGIPATVANLWQIDNQATYQLTELFYKYLNSGMPGDEALQQAKLEFLKGNDREHALPYFWAASLYFGKADIIQPAAGGGYYQWYVAGGVIFLLLLVVAWGLLRRR